MTTNIFCTIEYIRIRICIMYIVLFHYTYNMDATSGDGGGGDREGGRQIKVKNVELISIG